MALPSGAIWIGYHNGGASVLEKGKLTNYMKGIPRGAVSEFGVDSKNTIWAATDGGLARLTNGRWEEIGTGLETASHRFSRLLVSRDGTLWTSNETQVFFLRSGFNRFQLARTAPSNAFELTKAPDGRVWYVDLAKHTNTLLQSVETERRNLRISEHRAVPPFAQSSQPIMFDHEASLWQTYQYAPNSSGGISRTPQSIQHSGNTQNAQNVTSRFGMKDGLTSDIAGTLLEDREGNIWVGTNLGLDRFRAGNIIPEAGIPTTSGNGYRAAQGERGIFYVADSRTLFAIPPASTPQVVSRFSSMIMILHAARDGTLWVATADGRLFRLNDRILKEVALPATMASAYLFSCAEDKNGALWVSVNNKGIFRLKNGKWSHVVVRPDLAEIAPRIIAFDSQGRMWLHYRNEQLIVVDGKAIHSFSKSGLDVGEIESISSGPNGILVGGDLGLARVRDFGSQTLRSTQVPALQRIAGIAQTASGDVWINDIAGIVHMTRKDLDAAFAQPNRPPHYDLFDFRDGLPGLAQQDSYQPTVVEGSNNWLWFITNHGIARTDPTHLNLNPLPPPVSVNSLKADGKEYALRPSPTVQKGISNLQIDYTGLSLSVPDRVRFRYKLEGVDSEWIDPGGRRQAIYTRLGPGNYRFRVIAANNDGVWNNAGATLDFTIPPTFIQTRLFQLLCLFAGLAVIWTLYSLRLRQVSTRVRDRLEERIFERERIARELHDTLLQGFQALVLRLQNAIDKMPVTEPTHKIIEQELERADAVLIEGRDRVRNLRLTESSHDLMQAFTIAAETLQLDSDTEFQVTIDGTPRRLHPVVFDESVQIGTEAIFNAIRHANPKNIDAKIIYDRVKFCIQIEDDGVGIDPTILSRGGRQGHFGLTGMRERAKKLQAELVLFSQPGAGTRVTLTIPARLAYAESEGRIPWWPRRPRANGN